MMKYIRTGLIALVVIFSLLLVGCQANQTAQSIQDPFSIIPQEFLFDFEAFHIPNGWEITAIEVIYPRRESASLMINPVFMDQPNEVVFHFGTPHRKNRFDLEAYNQDRRERDALYAVTEAESFGKLYIKKFREPVSKWTWTDGLNGLDVPSIDDYQQMTIHDLEVIHATMEENGNPSFYSWLSEDKHYRFTYMHEGADKRSKTLQDTIPIIETLIIKQD